MRKISIFLFLVLFSATASAEWTFINSNSMNAIYFLNYQTLKVRPPYVQVWGLVNYGKPLGSGFNSEKSLYLFYCSEDKYKYLSSIFFSELDALGSVVDQVDEETNWLHIAPDTVIGAVSEAACSAARQKK